VQPVDLYDIKSLDQFVELGGTQKWHPCRTEEEVASLSAAPMGLLFNSFMFGTHFSVVVYNNDLD
jgi:hypothetical protein